LAKGKTDDLKTYIEVANTIGQTYIIIPSLNHNFIKTVDDCKGVPKK